ncbi:MAG: DNA-3-methyladenine glycosylase [Salibacteraceae bacterium]
MTGKLPLEFYQRADVVQVARDLLGKALVTCIDGVVTSGIITETEAYAGVDDRASHAFGARRTQRTEVMYLPGGFAYVYLIYGLHHLFNVVTNVEDIPHAVLVRAIRPEHGIDTMLQRRKLPQLNARFSGGPGTLSQALGITTVLTGTSLLEDVVWLEERPDHGQEITVGPRIGIDYAGEDALLPYRFRIQ